MTLYKLHLQIYYKDTGLRKVQNKTFSNDTECTCISRIELNDNKDTNPENEETTVCVCPNDFDSVIDGPIARDQTPNGEHCTCQCKRDKVLVCAALLDGRDRFSIADT